MTPAEKLLGKLDAVKQRAPDRWVAKCPAHADKRPSLSIRETADGALLVHCWTGCSAGDVVAAVGLELSDLYPERDGQHAHKGDRRPFPAAEALRAVRFEADIVSIAAATIAAGGLLAPEDHDRLRLAAERLRNAARGAGL